MKWSFFKVFFFVSLLFSANVVFAETRLVFDVMEQDDAKNVVVDISKEALKRVGYEVKIRFVPWERAMREAQSGKVDGIIGAWYKKERTEFFEYTDVVNTQTLILFKRTGQEIEYKTLMDLKDYTFGVVRGWTYTKEFDNADFLQKKVVSKSKQNILKLIHGRVDIVPEVKEEVEELMNSELPEHIGSIETVGEPLKVQEIYTMISKKNPNHKKIAEDFNKGLKMIKKDGTYAEIIKKD